jgi:hypothetical protein
MSWVRDIVEIMQKIGTVEDRISDLGDRYKSLARTCEDLSQRLARLEGKFELLERMGAARRRRLPPA